MSFSITVPSHFGYVIGSGLISFITLQVLGGKVGSKRKDLGVPYPYMYASITEGKEDPKKELFNCYQRGHQNALEQWPGILFMLVFGGLKHPEIAAVCGLLWSVGRIMYFRGYATGDPKKRQQGAIQYVGILGLLGTTISTALSILGHI